MNFDTTIVAAATPPGRGGVALVRLSGPRAVAIARALIGLARELQPRRATRCHLRTTDGRHIDDALLIWFAAPASYTGEEVVEIGTHGSPVVVQTVIELCLQHGAVPARAGEFTERAYLNHRLDLSQAEAVRDLIEATTTAQAALAAQQLGGSLAREVRPVKQALGSLIAALEAGIDFAEDDLQTLAPEQIAAQIDPLLPRLEALLRSFAQGRLLREGIRLAIVGKPNAGKSSLFNRLLERDRAIVTPIAGTTRDIVSERIVIRGIPVELLDTAGLRDTDDEVERIGVERSREAMADADVVLHVVEAANAPATIDSPRTLLVYTKADLLSSQQRAGLGEGCILTSATTGEGLDQLREAIAQAAGAQPGDAAHATLTNLRQRDAIHRAHTALERASLANAQAIPHEMLLLDLYDSLQALDDLTGETTSEAILQQIFSTFCIGK